MTNREDTTMTTRRTPTQMAQDALNTAERKVERAEARVLRARSEQIEAQIARNRARVERDYAAAHPLLNQVEAEDVTA